MPGSGFDATSACEGSIAIHDLHGRLLQVIAQHFEPGRNLVALRHFERWPVGMLYITVFDGTQNYSQRMVRQ